MSFTVSFLTPFSIRALAAWAMVSFISAATLVPPSGLLAFSPKGESRASIIAASQGLFKRRGGGAEEMKKRLHQDTAFANIKIIRSVNKSKTNY